LKKCWEIMSFKERLADIDARAVSIDSSARLVLATADKKPGINGRNSLKKNPLSPNTSVRKGFGTRLSIRAILVLDRIRFSIDRNSLVHSGKRCRKDRRKSSMPDSVS